MTLFITVLHIMVCVFLIAVVLLQRGRGAEVGAMFGGGGTSTVFGGRGAGNFLTRLTTGAAVVFMLTSLTLAYTVQQQGDAGLFEDGDQEAGGFEEVETPEGEGGGFEEVGAPESGGGGFEELSPAPASGDAADAGDATGTAGEAAGEGESRGGGDAQGEAGGSGGAEPKTQNE